MCSSKVLVYFLNQLWVSPDAVIWLCERLIGFLGLLRAIRAAVLGEGLTTSCSPDDSFLVLVRPCSPSPPTSLGPSPFPLMTESFNSTVAPTVLLVSVADRLPGYDPLDRGRGSVCMAVVVRSVLLRHLAWSSVEMATSTISEPKAGGKRTWESPLRELWGGVLEDKEEAEELEYEPW